MKECRDCRVVKPLEAFGKNSSRKDGLHYYCRPCLADRTRKWRAANPEKVLEAKRRYRREQREKHLAQRRAWVAKNREKVNAQKRAFAAQEDAEVKRERARRWRESNADQVRERVRRWRLEHPERTTEYARRYRYANDPDRAKARARRPNTRDAETAAFVEIIVCDPCCYCGEPGGTVDHIVALSKDGDNRWTNYTGACLACNGGKRERSLLQYLLLKAP